MFRCIKAWNFRGQPGLTQRWPRVSGRGPLHVRSQEPISTQGSTAAYGMWRMLRTFSRPVFSLSDAAPPAPLCSCAAVRARASRRAWLSSSAASLVYPPAPTATLQRRAEVLAACARKSPLAQSDSVCIMRRSAWKMAETDTAASDQSDPDSSRSLPSPDDRASPPCAPAGKTSLAIAVHCPGFGCPERGAPPS